jgi:cytochrome c-type biogenesis protein CcmH/NrfG
MNQDTDAEILAELRSLRRHTQYSVYSGLLVVLVLIGFVSWSVLERQRGWRATPQSSANTYSSGEMWSQISAATDEGDKRKAISIAQEFVTRRPDYYYAHELLGSAYISMNDFTNAELAYVRAIELYPDEGNEKTLEAIRKRLARDRTKATEAR